VTDLSLLTTSALALPWWMTPAVLALRLRAGVSLESVSNRPPAEAPRVSVILPARNEAAHIADFVRAVRASTWPNLELIVVDDHSTDATGDLARSAANGDPRVQVIAAPDLPDGWFGKQWACQVGASRASGELLLFTDADTRHAPDLVTRLVAMRAQRGAELMSVAGRQDMITLWEQAVLPLVFSMIMFRYGNTRALENATHASDVIANGQCFMISRSGYDSVGRHEAVRQYAAEDVMMAQAVWNSGRRVSLVLGVDQLRTRMYDGLSSLIRGWRKNVYAGGRFAMRGAVSRAFYPILLLMFPLMSVLPFVTLAIATAMWLSGRLPVNLMLWSVFASSGVLTTLAVANRFNRDPMHRALLAPLGAAVLLAICVQAIARGRQVEWKGREYRAGWG
jgi:chlorobactene glucosyltransferase